MGHPNTEVGRGHASKLRSFPQALLILCMPQLTKQRIKWFYHLMRIDPNLPVARVYSMQIKTNIGRGRQKKVDGNE